MPTTTTDHSARLAWQARVMRFDPRVLEGLREVAPDAFAEIDAAFDRFRQKAAELEALIEAEVEAEVEAARSAGKASAATQDPSISLSDAAHLKTEAEVASERLNLMRSRRRLLETDVDDTAPVAAIAAFNTAINQAPTQAAWGRVYARVCRESIEEAREARQRVLAAIRGHNDAVRESEEAISRLVATRPGSQWTAWLDGVRGTWDASTSNLMSKVYSHYEDRRLRVLAGIADEVDSTP